MFGFNAPHRGTDSAGGTGTQGGGINQTVTQNFDGNAASARRDRGPVSKGRNWKMYTCPRCGQAFSRKFNMKMHMQTHDPDRVKIPCDVCGLAFYRVGDLTRHRKVHIRGLLPFSCSTCGKEFDKEERLRWHVIHQCADPVVRVEESRSPSEAPAWDSLSPTASLSADSMPSAASWVGPPPPEHRRSLSGNHLTRRTSGEPLSANGGQRLDALVGAGPTRPAALIPRSPGIDAPWPTPPHLSQQPAVQSQGFGDSGAYWNTGFYGAFAPDQYGSSIDRLASKPDRFTVQQGLTPAVTPTDVQEISVDGQKRRPWEEGSLAEGRHTHTSLLPLQTQRGFPSLRPDAVGFGAPTPLSVPNMPFMSPPSSSSTHAQATTPSNLNHHVPQPEFLSRSSLYGTQNTIDASRPPITISYNLGSSLSGDHFPPPQNLTNPSTYQYAQLHNGQGVQSGISPRPSMISQSFHNPRLDYSDGMAQSHNRMRSLGNITTDYSPSDRMAQSVHNRMRSLGNITTDQQLFREVNRGPVHNTAGIHQPLHTGPVGASIYQHPTSIPPYRNPMSSAPPQLTYPAGGDLGFENGYTGAPLPQAFAGINRASYEWRTTEVDPSWLGYRNGFPSGHLAGWPSNR